MALAGAALLAAALPAAAQDAPAIFNKPGSSGTAAPYNFGPRNTAQAVDPLAEQNRKFQAQQAQDQAFALKQQQEAEARFAQMRQEIEATHKQSMAAWEQKMNQNRPRARQAAGNAAAPSGEPAAGGPQKKMIYTKPTDKEKEPGRLFNLKWR